MDNLAQLSSDWGDVDSFCTKYNFYDNVITNQEKQHLQQLTSSSDEHIHLFQNAPQHSSFQDSSNPPTTSPTLKNANQVSQKLSVEKILMVAGEKFVHISSRKFTSINMSFHPHGSSLSYLSTEDKNDVELVQLLLAAAEKVENQQPESAIRLLHNCQWISSNTGSPVQRVVYYFSEALLDRINGEKQPPSDKKQDDACLMNSNKIPAALAMHQELPFYQVIHFTAVQTILDNINNKSYVHLIDFQILTGLHWAPFMQAVSEQIISRNGHLKITAIETADKEGVKSTGKLLESFASYLNLPFSYNVVFLPDIKDLKQEDIGIERDEAVVVLFHFRLRILISKPNSLKNLITITQKIKPSIVVVCEVEANHNSPSFVNRFIEALFYYGALFDSLSESMAGDGKNRLDIESGTFRDGIRNIVATEGSQRSTRSVSMDVWRAFFDRFGMQEMELSTAAVYQACLIVNQFSCGKSCTLDVSKKCLIVGWKETPLFSLSAWKFT